MKTERRLPVVAGLVLICLLWVGFFVPPSPSTAASTSAPNPSTPLPTPVRGWEPVVLTPVQLPELKGTESARIRLFAWRERFVAIPFQIDEVSSSGRYVLSEGPEAEPRHRFFSGRDELVFLTESLADRAAQGSASPCGGVPLIPIAVGRAGETAPRGWVYATACSPEHPYSPVDYVRFDPAPGQVNATDHQLRFSSSSPMVPSSLLFTPAFRGTGQDLLRGIYVLGQVRLLGGMVRISRTIEDFRSTLTAWSDGPIRVIRRTPARARTVGERYTNPGTFVVDSVQQPGRVAFDVQLHTLHDISAYLNDMVMVVAWDFTNFSGMRLQFSDGALKGLVDGSFMKSERALQERDARWIYASGPQGSYLGRLIHAQGLPIERRLHYVEEPAGRLLLGYRLSQLHRLARGRTVFRAEILNLAGADYAAATSLTSEWLRPLIRLQM